MDGLDDNINNIATKLEVDVRGRRINAEIVALPFYKR
jgi:glycine cleavage system aminomethyltransferase T